MATKSFYYINRIRHQVVLNLSKCEPNQYHFNKIIKYYLCLVISGFYARSRYNDKSLNETTQGIIVYSKRLFSVSLLIMNTENSYNYVSTE